MFSFRATRSPGSGILLNTNSDLIRNILTGDGLVKHLAERDAVAGTRTGQINTRREAAVK